MIHTVCVLVSSLGFALLRLTMVRGGAFLGIPHASKHTWPVRALGFAVLSVALVIAIAGLGPLIGAIAWCGHLTLAALMVVLLSISFKS